MSLPLIFDRFIRFNHNFEDAHFEHDRIDAVAMERLTSSPHVINVFGFCGHSVVTEFADGPRVGELADKSKRRALARLKIARDIAHGLADVHGIDGEGNATFVHLDVNLANVVSINGTLKLNGKQPILAGIWTFPCMEYISLPFDTQTSILVLSVAGIQPRIRHVASRRSILTRSGDLPRKLEMIKTLRKRLMCFPWVTSSFD